jgi:hypothetical protein
MWFAQTPLPAELPANVTIPAGIQTEMITHPSFTMTQSVLLVIYFLIALALVICVTVQTGKSEGLMQQSMAGPSNSGPKGGGQPDHEPGLRLPLPVGCGRLLHQDCLSRWTPRNIRSKPSPFTPGKTRSR